MNTRVYARGRTKKQWMKDWLRRNPWYKHYCSARRRCVYPNDKDYKYYGAKGIKFLMDTAEIKILWIRDEAYLLNKPSIDRIDNKGNYEFMNCRFIEHSINSGRFNAEKTHCKQGHLLNEENIFHIKTGRVCRECSRIKCKEYRKRKEMNKCKQ